jgi:hypothetical protein
MRRTTLAALLAAPVLLAVTGVARANPPKQCYSPFGFGGVCVGWFSKLHQHGPLFNYGPYYGYPPFEPYGMWNSYLHYQGGVGGGWGGGHGHGHGYGHPHGDLSGRGGIYPGGGHGGLFHKHKGLFHHGSHGVPAGDCSSCTPTAFNTLTAEPLARYAGAGVPGNSAVYYPGLPTIHPITPASGFGK